MVCKARKAGTKIERNTFGPNQISYLPIIFFPWPKGQFSDIEVTSIHFIAKLA
jgi:hypothetical protein